MGAVNTTYTFTPTDTITSTKMNNIIDQTVMTSDAVLNDGGLVIASGQLAIGQGVINSSRLAANSVTSTNIVDGTIVNADINASAAIAGTKITPSFGNQEVQSTLVNAFRSINGGYGFFIRNDGTNSYFLLTDSGDPNGTFNALRPIAISNSTGKVTIGSSLSVAQSGSVGIGTETPYGKFTVSNDNQDGVSLYSSGDYSVILLGGFNNSTNGAARIIYDRDSGLFEIQNGQREDQTGRLTILANGNVGIGKTPTTKLDVNGTVTATAFAGGTVTGTTITGTTITGTSFVGAIPSGAIMPFAMNSAPSGWLAAHGTAVSRTTYSDLFDAIGTIYGAGNGSTTFNLPDIRGYFIRGNGTNIDGSTSGTFGAKQQDELQSHTHTTPGTMVGGGALSVSVYSNGTRTDSSTGTGATGGTETRPKNIAMLYCIKI